MMSKNKRRLKTDTRVMEEALSRNITLIGGLVVAVYEKAPLNRVARAKASRLRCKVAKKRIV